MVNGVRLRHGSDGEKWAAVPPQGFTQDILSQIDLRGPQSLQFRKVHLRIQWHNNKLQLLHQHYF